MRRGLCVHNASTVAARPRFRHPLAARKVINWNLPLAPEHAEHVSALAAEPFEIET